MKRALAAGLFLTLALPAAAARPKHKIKAASAPAEPRVAAAPPLYPVRSTEPIVFVWPPENMPLAAEGEFILGSVQPSTAPFTINGVTVTVHRDGGFLAWLPIAPGTFTFRGELTLSSVTTATAERHILVPVPAAPLPGKLAIDPASLSPKSDLELRGGDLLTVRMKATPGKPARFRVGKDDWLPMRAVNAALGTYEGTKLIAPGTDFEPNPVEYELGSGWSSIKVKGTARVSSSAKPFPVATVKTSTAGFTSVKTGPADGFLMFPLPGTRLPVTGRENGSLRVRLSDSLSGWIEAKDVEVSTVANAPRAVTGTIAIAKTELGATVKIGVSEKAAFDIEPSAGLDALTVRLYNATGHTNWMINDAPDFVQEVRWRQEATDVVAVTILLKPAETLWGWWPSYDGGSLRLDLRRAPKISEKKPLSGIKVMLDPGHMPSATGATGPLGTREMDANYAIALAAKARLERAGATVLMTRNDPLSEVSLVDRPRQAVERGADIFVSLHNNALPDGENPTAKPRGFTVFYYHPQSLELGRAVHEAYRERIKLADEGLRWGNLLVARQSAMPAILVETAYMIFPDQEALLNDAPFRDELAKALVTGLEKFLRSARRKP
ncbi:MAG: N-acetylmuramoyl-L-alanine amidase [Elusimicrobia bacterium]|nr:N-acetylmuramoyl-L-alanine amidase [Elusimicrobiota bacterium]